jgi:hypothetical protein
MALDNSQTKVLVGNQLTRPCAVTSGVREGDALSATLFNLALHKVIKKLKLMVLLYFYLNRYMNTQMTLY